MPERRFASAAALVTADPARLVRRRIEESIEAKQGLLAGAMPDRVVELAELIIGSLAEGGKVLLFGNGGSAADATHLAAEFVGRFERDRAGLPAIALTTDTSALTAIANDFGYERVFSRQVEALGRPGDVAIAISASG